MNSIQLIRSYYPSFESEYVPKKLVDVIYFIQYL